MKNTLVDLNNHLFEQLERLNDENLKGEELQEEIDRSKAVSDIASRIVSNASLALQAAKMKGGNIKGDTKLPEMLEEKQQ